MNPRVNQRETRGSGSPKNPKRRQVRKKTRMALRRGMPGVGRATGKDAFSGRPADLVCRMDGSDSRAPALSAHPEHEGLAGSVEDGRDWRGFANQERGPRCEQESRPWKNMFAGLRWRRFWMTIERLRAS